MSCIQVQGANSDKFLLKGSLFQPWIPKKLLRHDIVMLGSVVQVREPFMQSVLTKIALQSCSDWSLR